MVEYRKAVVRLWMAFGNLFFDYAQACYQRAARLRAKALTEENKT